MPFPSHLWFEAMVPQHSCLHAFAPAHPGQVHISKILFIGCSYDRKHWQLTIACRKITNLNVPPWTGCAPFPPLTSHCTSAPHFGTAPRIYLSAPTSDTKLTLTSVISLCKYWGSEVPYPTPSSPRNILCNMKPSRDVSSSLGPRACTGPWPVSFIH